MCRRSQQRSRGESVEEAENEGVSGQSHQENFEDTPGADPGLKFGEGHEEGNMGVWGRSPQENFSRSRPSDSRKTLETPLLLHFRSLSSSLNLHSF